MISYLGRLIIEVLQWFKGLILFFLDVLYWVTFGAFKIKPSDRESIFHQMVFVGIRSIIIVFFLNIFTGVVLAMQSAYQLERMGAILYVTALVAISLCRELGPVLTALVVAGRIGSAIAAELGTMKVTEQIEALETMAIDPVRFLAVPRFLALLLMLPCLTVLGDISGIVGGLMVGTSSLNISTDLYIHTTFKYLAIKDIYTGLIKSVIFGMIIALVGCYEGLHATGGAEGVGKATTRSVVISFMFILVVDCILTTVFYFSKI